MHREEKSPRFLPAVIALVLLFSSCQTNIPMRNRADENGLPPFILWAWERPEDLEFVDPEHFGVAFLAQTLVLKADQVLLSPRRHPLKVSPDTKLIAVTRIESQKTTGERAALSQSQREKLAALVVRTLELKNVSAIQIDFDAKSSEREFYRALLHDLRKKLPDNIPLAMTALASFCVGDRWLRGLPVDEAVPMIFRMGTDDKTIKSFLAGGHDFSEPLCRKSYGIALDEPLQISFDDSRRLYVFSVHPWTQKDLDFLLERIRR